MGLPLAKSFETASGRPINVGGKKEPQMKECKG
jgi:hypothetical protein